MIFFNITSRSNFIKETRRYPFVWDGESIIGLHVSSVWLIKATAPRAQVVYADVTILSRLTTN